MYLLRNFNFPVQNNDQTQRFSEIAQKSVHFIPRTGNRTLVSLVLVNGHRASNSIYKIQIFGIEVHIIVYTNLPCILYSILYSIV